MCRNTIDTIMAHSVMNIQTLDFSEGRMEHYRPGVPAGPGGPLSPTNTQGPIIYHLNPRENIAF